MNKIINAISVLLCLSIILLRLDDSAYDIRSQLLLTLIDGGIQAGLIFVLAIAFTVKIIRTENAKQTNGLISFLMLLVTLLSFIFFITVMMITSPPAEDILIYQSLKKPSKHLVVQYYETGITGNPAYRIIETENIETVCRKISLLPDSLLKEIIPGDWRNFQPTTKINYVNGEFTLREFHNPTEVISID